mmetsp:Transcript_21017/g.54780  ORF Transcript_21017/g.54780 Transcript_21017/m.54780 type:complete len:197 (+) Transcript_21017:5318-5908(+)
MASFCSNFARPSVYTKSSFWRGQKSCKCQLYGREAISSRQLCVRPSFDWSAGTKRVFPSSFFFIWRDRVPVRPEITHRLPTKRDATPLKKYASATRLRAAQSDPSNRVNRCARDKDDAGIIKIDDGESQLVAEFLDELRRRLGPAAHAEALATLRRYDQGLLSEKQVARAMDRLFHPSDHELRDAFRYFLPAELAV